MTDTSKREAEEAAFKEHEAPSWDDDPVGRDAALTPTVDEREDPGGRLFRSRSYRLLAQRGFTGHMDQGRRTAFYEGWSARESWDARRTVQGEPANATQQPDQLRSRAEMQHKAQGEPSDARVLAALNAHYRVRLAQSEPMPGDPEVQGDARSLEEYSSKSIDRMRAALRAATQEGENRA